MTTIEKIIKTVTLLWVCLNLTNIYESLILKNSLHVGGWVDGCMDEWMDGYQ
jgi:hypothetical protein